MSATNLSLPELQIEPRPLIRGLRRVAVPGGMGTLASFTIGLSFACQWLTVARVGTGVSTDSYFVGVAITAAVYDVLAGSIGSALVPMLASEDAGRARTHAIGLALAAGAVLLLIAAGLELSAPLWLRILVPGFTAAARDLTAALVRIQLLSLAFMAMAAVLYAYFQAMGRAVRAESAGVLASLVSLVFLAVFIGRFGIYAAAWAMVVRAAAEFTALIPGSGLLGSRPSIDGAFCRTVVRRLRAVVLSSLWYRSDLLVDRALASLAPAGGLSLLHLARQIQQAVARVMNRSLAVPLLPRFARLYADGRQKEFYALARRFTWISLGVSVVVVGGVALAGHLFLSWMFAGHGMTAANVTTLYTLTLLLAGVTIGDNLSQLFSNSFYAQKDTRTPSLIGAASYTIGVAARVAGFALAGIHGIAVGITCYFLLNAAMLGTALVLRRRLSLALGQ